MKVYQEFIETCRDCRFSISACRRPPAAYFEFVCRKENKVIPSVNKIPDFCQLPNVPPIGCSSAFGNIMPPRRTKMNTYLTSIHRHLGEEKESIIRQISILHEAKEDALAALEKLQFCIDHMEGEGETKTAPED